MQHLKHWEDPASIVCPILTVEVWLLFQKKLFYGFFFNFPELPVSLIQTFLTSRHLTPFESSIKPKTMIKWSKPNAFLAPSSLATAGTFIKKLFCFLGIHEYGSFISISNYKNVYTTYRFFFRSTKFINGHLKQTFMSSERLNKDIRKSNGSHHFSKLPCWSLLRRP